MHGGKGWKTNNNQPKMRGENEETKKNLGRIQTQQATEYEEEGKFIWTHEDNGGRRRTAIIMQQSTTVVIILFLLRCFVCIARYIIDKTNQ